MDLKEVKRSEEEAEEMNSTNKMKSCSCCHTTRTPLWRSGPSGPKTLCNACGIKYNKKRRQILGIDKSEKKKKKMRMSKEKNIREIGKLMALGSKLREEEQAAILLMALSCGSVAKLLF